MMSNRAGAIRGHPGRGLLVRYGGALAIIASAVIAGCASLKQAPDPAKIERQVAAARAEERALVRSTIDDAERAERFIELLSRRDQILARCVEEISAHRRKMAALTADYDTEREEFEALLDDFNGRRASAQAELIDLGLAMKQATTVDEWRKISRFQLKRLNPRELVYRGTGSGV